MGGFSRPFLSRTMNHHAQKSSDMEDCGGIQLTQDQRHSTMMTGILDHARNRRDTKAVDDFDLARFGSAALTS